MSNRIVESLYRTSGIELNESKKLNELFDSSVPKWLRKELSRYSSFEDGLHTTYTHDKGPRPSYAKGKGDSWRHENPAHSIFYTTDIDLSKMKVVETEPPAKFNKSPYKDLERYIPIFLLDNGDGSTSTYLKGLNDQEIDPTTQKAFKYTSVVDLIKRCKAFAYIDKEDPANQGYKQKHDLHTQAQNELRNVTNYERNKNLADTVNYNNSIWDKSGYFVDPDKYKKLLDQNKFSNLSNLLQQVYDTIKSNTSSTLSKILQSSDKIMDPDFSDIFKDVARLTRQYSDITSKLNSFTEENNGEIPLWAKEELMYDYKLLLQFEKKFEENIENLGLNTYNIDWWIK